MGNFKTFEDLEVYKSAVDFRKEIYKICKELPEEEKFNLINQMRRAALSLTNNIAEGHGRYHYQENIQFLRQSRGSLEELIDDINLCLQEKYSEEAKLNTLKNVGFELLKKLNSYIKYLRLKKEEVPLSNLTI